MLSAVGTKSLFSVRFASPNIIHIPPTLYKTNGLARIGDHCLSETLYNINNLFFQGMVGDPGPRGTPGRYGSPGLKGEKGREGPRGLSGR